jgi:hypothetical protein
MGGQARGQNRIDARPNFGRYRPNWAPAILTGKRPTLLTMLLACHPVNHATTRNRTHGAAADLERCPISFQVADLDLTGRRLC